MPWSSKISICSCLFFSRSYGCVISSAVRARARAINFCAEPIQSGNVRSGCFIQNPAVSVTRFTLVFPLYLHVLPPLLAIQLLHRLRRELLKISLPLLQRRWKLTCFFFCFLLLFICHSKICSVCCHIFGSAQILKPQPLYALPCDVIKPLHCVLFPVHPAEADRSHHFTPCIAPAFCCRGRDIAASFP